MFNNFINITEQYAVIFYNLNMLNEDNLERNFNTKIYINY